MQEIDVLGPPGTGKTTYLGAQVVEAVKKHGSDSVLIASFTKVAALELARKKVNGLPLPIDANRIGTLHAHCYRIIGNPVIAEGNIEEWNKEHPAFEMSKSQGSLDEPDYEIRKSENQGDELFKKLQNFRARMIPKELYPISVLQFEKKWKAWKFNHGYYDFTDLIEHVRDNFPYAPYNSTIGFFDEVQDFTPLELSLVREWGKKMDYFIMVGDDDQLIFSFKGAIPEIFSQNKDAKKRIVLSQSYRLPKAVFDYSDKWVRQLTSREQKEFYPRDEQGVLIRQSKGTWMKPESIIMDAVKLADSGYSVMILASCSYLLYPTIKELRTSGIPFHNPFRRERGDWNPLGKRKGVTAAERILAYLRPEDDVWDEYSRMWTGKEVNDWMCILESDKILLHGAKTAMRKLEQDDIVSVADMLKLVDEDTWGDIMFVAEDKLMWYKNNILTKRLKPMEYAFRVAEMRGARTLRKEPKITVGTIHSVKGAEADFVYVFPDLSPSGMAEWMRGGKRRDNIIRQFYVGFTRAKQGLILCPKNGPAAISYV